MTADVVDYLASKKCEECDEDFTPSRDGQKYCGRTCNTVVFHRIEAAKRKAASDARKLERNKELTVLNRDRYINKLDPRYTGPRNRSDTTIAKLVKDKAQQQPISVDIHIEQPKPKFNHVTPEDVEWAERQSSQHMRAISLGKHTVSDRPMLRRKLNFCPQCREYVNQDHEHTL